MTARLSRYQRNFCFAVEALAKGDTSLTNGKRHLILKARAGSGKTFSITQAMKPIPVTQRVVAVMFNKKNAEDIQPKLPQTGNCTGMTTHSLCFKVLVKNGASRRLDDRKVSNILDNMQMSFAERQLRSQIRKMVDIAKALGIVPAGYVGAYGLTPDTKETWESVIDRWGIDFDEDWQQEAAIAHTRTALRLSIDGSAGRAGCIDFSDMLYLPVIMRMAFPKYDWVFADEAQDLSMIQHEIIKRSINGTGHIVAVGDDRQALYFFRAADSESMARLRADLDAFEMPLPICYRCDKAVIREAKKVVPDIEWQFEREEGLVDSWSKEMSWADFTPDSAVLCPFNAPLVSVAFCLIRNKIACRILCRDLGNGLLKLLDRLQASTVADAERKLNDYFSQELERLSSGSNENKIQQLEDRVDTLRVFLEEAPPGETPAFVAASINALFSDSASGMVTLSTVHKSKGAEYHRVFFLDSHFLGYTTRKRNGRTVPLLPEEIHQKQNALYVGITRAAHHLTYVTSEDLKVK